MLTIFSLASRKVNGSRLSYFQFYKIKFTRDQAV